MTATTYTTGRARLHLPGPALAVPAFRALLPVAQAGGVTAEIPPADDAPTGHPPVVAVWSEGFDAELDAAALDDFLDRLDAFRDGLKALRMLMGPVLPTAHGPRALQADDDADEMSAERAGHRRELAEACADCIAAYVVDAYARVQAHLTGNSS